MPTFQRRDLVCDMVEALWRIDYGGEFEVIVVVDGSTDNSASALRQLDHRGRLQVIEQANHGAAHARNRGALRPKVKSCCSLTTT